MVVIRVPCGSTLSRTHARTPSKPWIYATDASDEISKPGCHLRKTLCRYQGTDYFTHQLVARAVCRYAFNSIYGVSIFSQYIAAQTTYTKDEERCRYIHARAHHAACKKHIRRIEKSMAKIKWLDLYTQL